MSGNTNSDILLAGAVAAFTVDLLVYPLDTLKTRIQSPNYAKLYTNAATQKANPALFRGLYQGVGSVIIATLPSCKEPYFVQDNCSEKSISLTFVQQEHSLQLMKGRRPSLIKSILQHRHIPMG